MLFFIFNPIWQAKVDPQIPIQVVRMLFWWYSPRKTSIFCLNTPFWPPERVCIGPLWLAKHYNNVKQSQGSLTHVSRTPKVSWIDFKSILKILEDPIPKVIFEGFRQKLWFSVDSLWFSVWLQFHSKHVLRLLWVLRYLCRPQNTFKMIGITFFDVYISKSKTFKKSTFQL